MTVLLADVAAHLDALLRVDAVPDYPNAINGVQFAHTGPVRRVASAVDASARAIRAAASLGANLLLVHHGLFWGGLQASEAFRRERVRLLLEHDMALYSAHLPLDVHETFGNSRLLANEIGFRASGGFAWVQRNACGVRGECDRPTADIVASCAAFAARHGGHVVASEYAPDRRTKRWAACSGAGAGVETLAEAADLGVDTLIVGEGPHWTAVDAPERGLVIVYAGHYATETLGVRAVGTHLEATFGVPHDFIAAPSGL